jgi:hypothetical protein
MSSINLRVALAFCLSLSLGSVALAGPIIEDVDVSSGSMMMMMGSQMEITQRPGRPAGVCASLFKLFDKAGLVAKSGTSAATKDAEVLGAPSFSIYAPKDSDYVKCQVSIVLSSNPKRQSSGRLVAHSTDTKSWIGIYGFAARTLLATLKEAGVAEVVTEIDVGGGRKVKLLDYSFDGGKIDCNDSDSGTNDLRCTLLLE